MKSSFHNVLKDYPIFSLSNALYKEKKRERKRKSPIQVLDVKHTLPYIRGKIYPILDTCFICLLYFSYFNNLSDSLLDK